VDIFILIVVITWGLFWVYWFISAWMTRSPVKRRQSRRSWIFVMLLAGLLILFLSTSEPGFLERRVIPDGSVIGLMGTLITLLGLGFAVWARVHLGKNWSSLPAIRMDHTLIRTGPYSLVRHPIYTGLLSGIAGTVIILGEPMGLIALILVFVVSLGKIHLEEKYLEEEFGEDYTRYKKEVPALIPFLV
jgi:protein-S-isoprenylcysteine O-methyltransferase Ste14